MLVHAFFLFASCSSTKESSFGYPSYTHDQQQETADTSEPSIEIPYETISNCPIGMVPIPSESPIFCIMECEASSTDTGIVSQKGTYPSSNISFYDAQEYCASQTHEGIPMRLPTIEEWQDAGDGVVGSGGTSYPWGNELHTGECVLPYEDIVWDSFQPCGYLETCVSTFGVYDQIGNLWEWAATNLYTDINSWMHKQEGLGYLFWVDNGFLHTESQTLHNMHPFVIGLPQATIDIVDGMIWVRVNEAFRSDLPSVGYLKSNNLGNPSSDDFLPISLSWDDQRHNAQIVLAYERDGEPIPAKVGGAYYSGADSQLDMVFWGHVPNFDGSIGFRCIVDVP